MARRTSHHRSGLMGRHFGRLGFGWLVCLSLFVGLAGIPAPASANPLSVALEDQGGGAWDPDGQNRSAATRLFNDVLTGKSPDVSALLVAAAAITHTPDGNFVGPDGFEQYAAAAWSAFPEATFVIDEVVAGENLLTLRWTMSGRHLEAHGDLAATGVDVRVQGLAFLRFDGGMIAASWLQYDRMALVEQIAAVPDESRICPPCDEP